MVKLNLKPTEGYLIIEPMEAETKTKTGIYLPENKSDEPQKGTVLAKGNGTDPIQVGDVVYHKKWGGNEVAIEGKNYLFAKIEDILAVEK